MDVIKLGGSVITDKSRECTLRPGNLSRLTREIATSPERMMLVHGAGSFGHMKAKKGGVQHGLSGLEGEERRGRLSAAAEVQADVRRLNNSVLDACVDAGIPVFSLPPAAIGLMRSKLLTELDMAPFKRALELDMVPLSFGDVVPDEELGLSICSGDQVVYLLAKELEVHRAIFVCDVDGLYDSDPHRDQGARRLPRLTVEEARRMELTEKKGDVTGAMGGKLHWAAKTAELGIPVYFVNGKVPDRVAALLRGEEVPNTLLEA